MVYYKHIYFDVFKNIKSQKYLKFPHSKNIWKYRHELYLIETFLCNKRGNSREY